MNLLLRDAKCISYRWMFMHERRGGGGMSLFNGIIIPPQFLWVTMGCIPAADKELLEPRRHVLSLLSLLWYLVVLLKSLSPHVVRQRVVSSLRKNWRISSKGCDSANYTGTFIYNCLLLLKPPKERLLLFKLQHETLIGVSEGHPWRYAGTKELHQAASPTFHSPRLFGSLLCPWALWDDWAVLSPGVSAEGCFNFPHVISEPTSH